MPLNITTGGMSARGFGFTTQGYYNLNLTIASNTTNYNVYSAAIAAGWTNITDSWPLPYVPTADENKNTAKTEEDFM